MDEFKAYFKMMKMGLPKGAAQQKMIKDGKDPAILDMDPEKPLPAPEPVGGAAAGPPLKDIEEYKQYFKMMKMGLPKGAAQQKMIKDGKDPAILDMAPEQPLPVAGGDEPTGPPLKDIEEYQQYFKMMKMGLPKGAAQQKMIKDGKDPAILDMDPEKPLPGTGGGGGGGKRAPVKKVEKPWLGKKPEEGKTMQKVGGGMLLIYCTMIRRRSRWEE
jgi:hypothetical protein